MSGSGRPFLGRAVQNGAIRYLSVSSVKAFDPTGEGGCHRRWWFRYVKGKKEPETEAMRRGTEVAREIEHYFKTGEDVLRREVRAGKHLLPVPGPDLEVEKPLGDIARALLLRDEHIRRGDFGSVAHNPIEEAAGLAVLGIPFTGAADLRHRRGEYTDGTGALQREEDPSRTCEVLDHKTSSNIAKYGKTAEELAGDVQMLGYAVHAANIYPDVTRVRLSHVYYGTRQIEAAKRTALITIDDAAKRWARVRGVVLDMVGVARETEVERIAPNTASCRAYGRPCPHADYCPLSREQSFDGLFGGAGATPSTKEDDVGLLDKLQNPAPPLPPPAPPIPPAAPSLPPPAPPLAVVAAPPLPPKAPPVPAAPPLPPGPPPLPPPLRASEPAGYRVSVEAEKERLRAEGGARVAAAPPPPVPPPPPVSAAPPLPPPPVSAAPPPPASSGTYSRVRFGDRIPVTACDAGKRYLVLPAPGAETREMVFFEAVSARGAYVFRDAAGGPPVELAATADVWEVAEVPLEVGAVLPPDAAVPARPEDAASPLPPEVIAAIEDPEIRQRAEAHAEECRKRDVAERAAVPASAKRAGSRCGSGTVRREITETERADKKAACAECGKFIGIRPAKNQETGRWEATLKGHCTPKAGDAEEETGDGALPGQLALPETGVPPVPTAPPASAPPALAVVPSVAAPPPPPTVAVPHLPLVSDDVHALEGYLISRLREHPVYGMGDTGHDEARRVLDRYVAWRASSLLLVAAGFREAA